MLSLGVCVLDESYILLWGLTFSDFTLRLSSPAVSPVTPDVYRNGSVLKTLVIKPFLCLPGHANTFPSDSGAGYIC